MYYTSSNLLHDLLKPLMSGGKKKVTLSAAGLFRYV